MIGKIEKNRIIRLKRQANYLRSRAENDELTKKQQTMARANADAISWAINQTIVAIERREKDYIRDKLLDRIIRYFGKRKYYKHKEQYDRVEQNSRDLMTADIMDHEKTFEGQAAVIERKAAEKGL